MAVSTFALVLQVFPQLPLAERHQASFRVLHRQHIEKLIPVATTALDVHLASIDLLVVIAVSKAGRASTVTNARGASDCSHIVATAGHATGSAAANHPMDRTIQSLKIKKHIATVKVPVILVGLRVDFATVAPQTIAVCPPCSQQ